MPRDTPELRESISKTWRSSPPYLAVRLEAFHSLRHTLATALFARGEHPKVVQSLLGHLSITQTMDTYSHLMEDIGDGAVGGLDEAFG